MLYWVWMCYLDVGFDVWWVIFWIVLLSSLWILVVYIVVSGVEVVFGSVFLLKCVCCCSSRL